MDIRGCDVTVILMWLVAAWHDGNKMCRVVRCPRPFVSGLLRIRAQETRASGGEVPRNPRIEQTTGERGCGGGVGGNDSRWRDALLDPIRDRAQRICREIVRSRSAAAMFHIRDHKQAREIRCLAMHFLVHGLVPVHDVDA
jgi:hypothetical protein